jgi:bacterioferritin (cytochrome b1)
MFKLTQDAKRSIIILLNKCLEMEYAYTVNYSRLIDQLISNGQVPDPDHKLRSKLEALSKKSAEHLHWTARLIEDLGGEPQWQLAAVDRIVDAHAMLFAQLENEQASLSLFQQAKNVAEYDSDDVLAKMKAMLGTASGHITERGNTIRLLEQMSRDEEEHVAILKSLISAVNIPPEK